MFEPNHKFKVIFVTTVAKFTAVGKFPTAVGKFPTAVGKFPTAVGKFPTAVWNSQLLLGFPNGC